MKLALYKTGIIYVKDDSFEFTSECDDVTCIRTWWANWESLGIDFLTVVKEIKSLYSELGWESLSGTEKEIVVRCLLATKEERDSEFTFEEQVDFAEVYQRLLQKCRKDRVIRTLALLRVKLTPIDYESIGDIMIQGGMYGYIHFEKNYLCENLFSGLAKMVPTEGTLEELKKEVSEILL